MAILSDLVRVVAEATGDPEATITVLARSLREADFIATRGRGRGAAKMTSHDAASLLLGVGSPGDTTKAAETLRMVRELKLGPLFETTGLPILRIEDYEGDLGLRVGQTLHDCLSFLLDRLIDPPEETVAPINPRAELAPGTRRSALEPFAFSRDTWPDAVGLEIVRDCYGLNAHLLLRLRGGDALKLHFTSGGQSWVQVIVQGPAEERGGKRSSITLLPQVANEVVICLKGGSPKLAAGSGETSA